MEQLELHPHCGRDLGHRGDVGFDLGGGVGDDADRRLDFRDAAGADLEGHEQVPGSGQVRRTVGHRIDGRVTEARESADQDLGLRVYGKQAGEVDLEAFEPGLEFGLGSGVTLEFR